MKFEFDVVPEHYLLSRNSQPVEESEAEVSDSNEETADISEREE